MCRHRACGPPIALGRDSVWVKSAKPCPLEAPARELVQAVPFAGTLSPPTPCSQVCLANSSFPLKYLLRFLTDLGSQGVWSLLPSALTRQCGCDHAQAWVTGGANTPERSQSQCRCCPGGEGRRGQARASPCSSLSTLVQLLRHAHSRVCNAHTSHPGSCSRADSDPVGLGQGPRLRISNPLPGDLNAAGSRATLRGEARELVRS